MSFLKRYREFYKNYGLIKTIQRIIFKPLRYINKKIAYINFIKSKKKIFSQETIKDRFTYIYSSHYWPSKESVSGPGSEIENTKNIRKELINLIKKYNIKFFLDIPCGDFNWIKNIIDKNIKYVGGDIVKELIERNNKKFSQPNVQFIEIDIIKDKLPPADIILCRDCLIHFSYDNIKKFFKNFVNSEIDYILVTSYESNKNSLTQNYEIKDGDFRPLFLMKHPFNLPAPLAKIADKDTEHDKNSNLKCYLYLYSKNQLKYLIEN